MNTTQSARHTIRKSLFENVQNNPTYETIVLFNASAILLAGREGLTLADRHENFVKLWKLINFLYPKGSVVSQLESQAFKLVQEQISALDPNPSMDVDALENDFYKFLSGNNEGS